MKKLSVIGCLRPHLSGEKAKGKRGKAKGKNTQQFHPSGGMGRALLPFNFCTLPFAFSYFLILVLLFQPPDSVTSLRSLTESCPPCSRGTDRMRSMRSGGSSFDYFAPPYDRATRTSDCPGASYDSFFSSYQCFVP